MADRERVIKALKYCISQEGRESCDGCEYKDQYRKIHGCQIDSDALKLLENSTQVIRCKDCKYFSVKDHWQGMILGASDCPTCMRWAGGNCKTVPEGYCFLAERRE